MKHLDAAIRRVAVNLYRYIATPRSLAAYILLQHGEWDQLVTLQVDPRNYLDTPSGSHLLRGDLMASDFLRKHPDIPTSFNRKLEAQNTFQVCERQCYQTNELIDSLDYPLASDPEAFEGYRRFLLRVRKIVSRVLGPLPSEITPTFGPGTSLEMKGRPFSTLVDKVLITPSTTSLCSDIFEHYFWPCSWGRERLRSGLPLPTITRGNRFSTVPKDAKTDRGICIEPLGNVWLQLGVGSYIKGRLGSVGIHVWPKKQRARKPCDFSVDDVSRPNGQFLHQRLARDGSRSGEWATIDLSNASDTVAKSLVRACLPDDWFLLLNSLRSPMTLFNGRWVHLEKFSSMGNGFTFELETLLFSAFAEAAGCGRMGEDVFCYGDDIIVRKNATQLLGALRTFGFTPNSRKTFLTGAFRESCGGDYFDGWPVRPVYWKRTPTSPLHWMALHNRLVEWLPLGARPRGLLRHIMEQVPSRDRLTGPRALGDSVFHSVAIPPRIRWRDSIRRFKVLKPIYRHLTLDRWSGELTLSVALLGVRSRGVVPRGDPIGHRSIFRKLS